MNGSRHRAWRAALSALAGGGLTVAGLGGPLSAAALGGQAPTGSTTSGEDTQSTQGPTQTPTSGTNTTTTTGTITTGASSSPPPTTSTSTSPTPAATSSDPTTPSPAPASTPAPAGETAPTAPESTPTVVVRHQQPTSPSRPANGSLTQTRPTNGATQPANGGASVPATPGAGGANGAGATATGPNNVALPPQLVAGQADALAAMLSGSTASIQALDFYRIPLFLLPIYQAAAVQYDVPWQILAAINEIETDYGADQSISSAGAVGWMQFMPQTWLQYGVDALNAGYADPYNPIDAIFAAARYLRAAGASSNLRTAILAYNHSEAYASSVLLRAKLIAAYPGSVIATLTGLTDGRPPVTGKRIAWGPPPAATTGNAGSVALPPTSSATAGASAVAGTPGAAANGQTPAPTGATAATTAQSAPTSGAGAATPGSTAASPTSAAGAARTVTQLVDVMSAPNAAVVAVQDGRVVKLGSSRKLGKYVILQDVYGDVFTYAGLGSIASSYMPPKPQSQVAADESSTAGSAAAVPTVSAATAASTVGSTAQAATATAPTPTTAGKVRVFAHPDGNPDALAVAARAKAADGTSTAGGRRPLRSGSVVTEGTVLGHVRVPPNAKDGHLRFAIRPAGDTSTIDPRAILANWTQLDAALHPRGAKGNPSLLGATANDVFLLSKSQLEREVLSDPGIAMSACSRHEVLSGSLDKRALAVLAFLSRSGLKPTVGTLRCGAGAYAVAGYVAAGHSGDAVAITQINGVPIAGHQGAGSITDTTIRTLLTLQGEYVPARIVSLMQYPGAPATLARADHGDYIEVVFAPAPLRTPGLRSPAAAAAAAHSAGAGKTAPATPVVVNGELSSPQWEQLIGRIAALPAPTVAVKPSSAAIPDSKSSTMSQAAASSRGLGSGSAGG
jgi:hypothetical protein